jgi:hypothetical protein
LTLALIGPAQKKGVFVCNGITDQNAAESIDKSKIRENYSSHSGQVFSENLSNYSIVWTLEESSREHADMG